MKFSKGGIDKTTGRSTKVPVLYTTSLKDIIGMLKNNSILQIKAQASATIKIETESLNNFGATFKKSIKSYFKIDFDSKKNCWDNEKTLFGKMEKYGIEDACVEKLFIKFKDPELAEIANEMADVLPKEYCHVPEREPTFIAHFFNVPFESRKDREIILETEEMKDKIINYGWKIRKLKLTYLIDYPQTITTAKNKHKPLIKWTLKNKLEDSLKSDALIAARFKELFSPYAKMEWYEQGQEDILFLVGCE